MTKPTHGVWIDDNPRAVVQDGYWRKMKEHGLRVGAMMLESVSVGFDPRFNAADLGVIANRARHHDVELVATVWPEPRRDYLVQLEEKLPALLVAMGAGALEFDAESNYIPKKVRGFKDLEEASEALVETVDRIITKAGGDIRLELTTFTEHLENGRSAKLAPHMHRVVPQAYSVCQRRDATGEPFEVPWDHAYGPGSMQTRTIEKALSIPRRGDLPALSVGLAAYEQTFRGHEPEEAMRVAYQAALKHAPREVRWWSSKWIFGGVANGYASRFLRSLL